MSDLEKIDHAGVLDRELARLHELIQGYPEDKALYGWAQERIKELHSSFMMRIFIPKGTDLGVKK